MNLTQGHMTKAAEFFARHPALLAEARNVGIDAGEITVHYSGRDVSGPLAVMATKMDNPSHQVEQVGQSSDGYGYLTLQGEIDDIPIKAKGYVRLPVRGCTCVPHLTLQDILPGVTG